MATLEFLGGVETVTESKFLVEAGGRRLRVDCGLYQGLKALRLRNWEPLPVDPRSIDWVVLTHGHIDHTGYLPRLFQDGFDSPVYATRATAGLLRIPLPDSGHLQGEEAAYHNRRGTTPQRGSAMMMPWGMFGWGAGGFGLVFMLLFWVLLIAGIVLVVKWLVERGRPGGAPASGGESALDILKKRYARGEIDKEEFEAKKQDLV